MAEMATKARAFQDFLDAKDIKAFVSETIENDPEQTTVFRSRVEVDGQALPLLVLLDRSIFSMIRVQISPKCKTEENELAVLKLANDLNLKYKPFKLYFDGAFPQTADLKKPRTCPFVSVFSLSDTLCCVYSNKQFRIEENTLEYDSRMFPRSLQSHSAGLSRRRPSTFTATNREIPCRLASPYLCVFFSQPVCACASALPPGAPANRCTSRSKMSST